MINDITQLLRLFYIGAYSRKLTEERRFLVSADNENQARLLVNRQLTGDYLIRHSRMICFTPETIFEELL